MTGVPAGSSGWPSIEAAARSSKAGLGRAGSVPASWSPTTVDTGGGCVSGREVDAGSESTYEFHASPNREADPHEHWRVGQEGMERSRQERDQH